MFEHDFQESRLEKAVYRLRHTSGEVVCLVHSHVDDMKATWNTAFNDFVLPRLAALEKRLHTSRKSVPFTYCGRYFEYFPSKIRISQSTMAESLDQIDIEKHRRLQKKSDITEVERSGYRSLLGQLLWLLQHTRPDIACSVSERAQRTNKATVEDLISLNALQSMWWRPLRWASRSGGTS